MEGVEDILRAYQILSPSEKKSYLSLHGYACQPFREAVVLEMKRAWKKMPKKDRTVLSIWVANGFGSVFLHGARINHSCLPNVDFAFNTALDKQTFHAIRDIRAGEELTIMYKKVTNRTRGNRYRELDTWGFKCGCPVCENTPQAGEMEVKRAKLEEMDQQLAILGRIDRRRGTVEAWRWALKLCQTMSALQKSQGLLNRELSTSYHDAARYSARLGDAKMALLWAEKELEVDAYCIGKDNPEYQMTLETIDQLRNRVNSSEPLDPSTINWLDPPDAPSTALHDLLRRLGLESAT